MVIFFIAVIILSLLFFSPYAVDYRLKEQHSPRVVHGQLSNGLKYAIVKNEVKKGKFSTFLQVNTGSTNELDFERGLSHMVEHMAFDNSKQFPGRGGTWRQISQGGIGSFNAYTSFRSTVYMFLDVINDGKTGLTTEAGGQTSNTDETVLADNIKKMMNIFYSQVQEAKFMDAYLQIEKGAVLGEARMRNSSASIALEQMLSNHGGNSWRVGQRYPIGTQPIIKSWTVEHLNNYYQKWYRLDKMTLYFVGDVDQELVKKVVEEFWSPKQLLAGQQTETTPNIPIGSPAPKEKFWLTEVDGVNGINFNMVLSQPYVGHPRDANYYRREFGDYLFTITYTVQVISRLLAEYPASTLADFETRNAGVSSLNQYAFDSYLTIFAILTPGPRPNSGTWRKDLSIAVEEMYGLAKVGPSKTTIMALAFLVPYLLPGSSSDSTDLIVDLLGDEDPNHLFNFAAERNQMYNQFSGLGFARTHQLHIQAQAQLVYNALFELVHEGQNVTRPFTQVIESPPASMNIFIGRNEAPFGIAPITENDVKEQLKLVFKTGKAGSSILSGLGGFSGLEGSVAPSFSPLEPRKPKRTYVPKLVDSNDDIKLRVFELPNGIRVNIKANDDNSASPDGYARMQVVALGGKSVLTPELKGACEFVNLAPPVGYRYYHDGEEYRFSGAQGDLTCEADFLVIDLQLRGACLSSALCNLQSFNYTDAIESALLWMNPMYDNKNIDDVVDYYKSQERLASTIKEPMDYLTASAVQSIVNTVFANESRIAQVTAEDIAKLHPLAVQYWVSNQFRPDRIEINVIGDLDNTILMEDLNRWIGSLPTEPRGAKYKLGHDVYDTSSVAFDVSFPTEQSEYACNLPSIAPDRGYVAAIYPANVPTGHNFARLLLEDHLFADHYFDVIRSLNGFSYFASTKNEHLNIMRGASMRLAVWQTGDYPVNNSTSDDLNMDTSLNVAAQALRTPLPERIFIDSKLSALAQLSSQLQIADNWLPLMRGISLTAPAGWSKSDASYLKSIKQVDVMSEIRKLTFEDMKNSLVQPTVKYSGELRAKVATVPLSELEKQTSDVPLCKIRL